MKKILSAIVAISMVFALTACGSKQSSAEGENTIPANQASESSGFKFEKDITMVVPTNPGSTIDTYAQKLAEMIRPITGKNVEVEYKNGGATGVAMNYLMAQKNDGYTAMITGITTECSIASGQMQDFDPDRYYCAAVLNSEQLLVAAPSTSPFNTMEDIINYCKENPGKLSWGAPSTYGPHHFFVLNLQKIADVSVNYVPYGSASETILASLGGNVNIITGTESAIIPYVESGELKIIAQGMENRQDILPDVPTIYETKGLEFEKFGVNFLTNRTIMLRADCSDEIKTAWGDLLTKVYENPEWITFCENLGANNSVFCVGDTANTFSHDYVEIYRELYDANQV